jgi:hypothetical protein
MSAPAPFTFSPTTRPIIAMKTPLPSLPSPACCSR